MTPDTDIDRYVERFRTEIDAWELARLAHPSNYRRIEPEGPGILPVLVVAVGLWAGVIITIVKYLHR